MDPHHAHSLSFLLGTLASALGIFLLLTVLIRAFNKAQHPAVEPVREVKNVLLPGVLILFLMLSVFHISAHDPLFRVAETVFWCLVIWVSPALLKSLFFTRTQSGQWQARVPELFLDLLRFSFVAVGSALVFSWVWGQNLGGFFATLGVGSIVLGFALQDTLGNLMAGIALLFERPFSVGHWIRVGDTVGSVREMNWRAVHLYTFSNDLIIVPNSVLGKERIQNFNRPTRLHAVEVEIGFSYNDPPNKVKRVLIKIAESTGGVVAEGILIRTVGYTDFAVTYQVRFFIEDYGRLPDIREEFLTQVWYAVRRNKLTIPFPIRTVYKTEMPFTQVSDTVEEVRQALRTIEIFAPLSEAEIDTLARDAIIQDFARGERVVYQGDEGDTLYLIRSGNAAVSLAEANGTERELAQLGPGQFFGEMALLTGELRSAHVSATDDLEVIVIYKSAMEHILRARPELAEGIANVVEARQNMLRAAQEQSAAESAAESRTSPRDELLGRIKRFFGIRD